MGQYNYNYNYDNINEQNGLPGGPDSVGMSATEQIYIIVRPSRNISTYNQYVQLPKNHVENRCHL